MNRAEWGSPFRHHGHAFLPPGIPLPTCILSVARIVLPLNIYSSAYVTMNARAVMNFLSLRRSAPESRFPSFPQREIEMVAEKYEAAFAELMPLTHAAFIANGRVAP